MRIVHKWSNERAKNVCTLYNLRKKYEWHVEKPVRQKASKKHDIATKKPKKGDYHVVKLCPVVGCLSTTVKISRHLTSYHKMKRDEEYYQLLKEAKPHIPYTKEVRKSVRESRKREEQRKAWASEEHETETEVQQNILSATIHTDSESLSDSNKTTAETKFGEVDAVMAKFLAHLLSPDGGKREYKSSMQTVQEVRTTISALNDKVYNLVDRYQVRDNFFRDNLDKKCKPGTSKHYMSSLISFMDFAISEELMLPSCTIEDFTIMKLCLYKWRKVYNKQIEEQRWIDETDDLEILVTPEQKGIFDKGELSRNAVKLFGRVAEDENFSASLLEYTNMRDYLMTTIALANAHRSGVSANMKIDEFVKAKYDFASGNYLIKVAHHKTLRKHGPAVVCLPQEKFQFLDIFVNRVRPKIPTYDYVFVSWNGKQMHSGAVSKQINSIWQRSGVYGENPPPKKNLCTTVIRKSVTTLVHDQEEQHAQPVADLLAHSLQTAKNVYRTRNREKQAIIGSAIISKVFDGTPTDICQPDTAISKSPANLRLRTPWTGEEELEVKRVFADLIKNQKITLDDVRNNLPKLTACRKNEKQVYDKIRTIIQFDNFDANMMLPVEEESLSDKIQRLEAVPACENDDDGRSIITESQSSRLTGLQKLFDTNESQEIKLLCHHIALSGPISIPRIKDALSQSELGKHILMQYSIPQIQSRIKYERRQKRLQQK